MKKRIIAGLLTLAVIISAALGLSSCARYADEDSFTIEEGVVLRLNTDKASYSVTSLTDRDVETITIPDKYNGKKITRISLKEVWHGLDSPITTTIKKNENVKTLKIGKYVKSIDERFFNYYTGLTEINVSESNNKFKSIDGVLFSKNGKTLIRCPIAKAGDYNIPNKAVKLDYSSFQNCKNLTNITIHKNVKYIYFSAFYGLTSEQTIYI